MFTSNAVSFDTTNATTSNTTTTTKLDGLPKVRTASKAATLFRFSEIFDSSAVGLAFDDEVIKQALSGRVCHQFVKLSATVGMIVPTGKAQFDVWSAGQITSSKGPFTATGRSVQYCTALGLIRETLGLSAVTMGAWSLPKVKGVPKVKKITAPSKGVTTTPAAPTPAAPTPAAPTPAAPTPAAPTAPAPAPDMTPYLTPSVCIGAAVASIIDSLDALTMAQLQTLQLAITEAMAKIATF